MLQFMLQRRRSPRRSKSSTFAIGFVVSTVALSLMSCPFVDVGLLRSAGKCSAWLGACVVQVQSRLSWAGRMHSSHCHSSLNVASRTSPVARRSSHVRIPHARPNEWQIEAEVVDAMRASDCGCTCDALLKCTRFAEEELRHLYASLPAVSCTAPRGAKLSATWRLRGWGWPPGHLAGLVGAARSCQPFAPALARARACACLRRQGVALQQLPRQ